MWTLIVNALFLLVSEPRGTVVLFTTVEGNIVPGLIRLTCNYAKNSLEYWAPISR